MLIGTFLLTIFYVFGMSTLSHAFSTILHTPGHLRRLSPSIIETGSKDFDVNIVVVPEVGAPSGKEFSATPWTWLDISASNTTIKPQILIFDYTVAGTGVPVWQSLVDRGSELLNNLLADQDTIGLFARPMVFVSHGLGGVIVKRALSLPYGQNYNPVFQRFLDVHTGLLFLGTPHPTYTRRREWQSLNPILRASMKLSKASLASAELEAAIIANVSLKFEETNIEVSVLSAYENRPTKISDGLLRSHKLTLVGRDFAETSLKYETMLSVDKSHYDICSVEKDGELYKQFVEMIRALQARPMRASFATESASSGSYQRDDWVSTAPDLEIQKVIELSDSHDRTKDGVFGTTDTSSYEIIPTINDFIQGRPAPKLPCRLLGPGDKLDGFSARETVLSAIAEALKVPAATATGRQGQDPIPRSFALCGLGGLGKSQIAIEYLQSHKDDYDAVFWVQADNNNSIAESFTQIAAELELLNTSEMKDSVIGHNVAMDWLTNPIKESTQNREEETAVIAPKATWLIIFDNADDLEILRDYWPATGNGAVLLTSRDPMAKTYTRTTRGIDLSPLGPQDASKVLFNLSGLQDTPKNKIEALALADRLGGLPLAITQVATMIRSRDLTFREFIELFEEEDSQHDIIRDEGAYGHTLSTICRLERLDPHSARLLHVLSLLDPDYIFESFIVKHLPTNAENNFPRTNLQYIEARTALLKTSMVKRNKDQGQLILHRLIQDVTRAQMTPAELQVAFETIISMLVQSWPSSSYSWTHEVSLWSEEDKLVPHILRLADIFGRNPHWNIPIDCQRELAELLQKAGWHVGWKGNLIVADRLFVLSLDICERNADAMPEQYADALFCAGTQAADTNQFKLHMEFAKKHFEVRMEIENTKPTLGIPAGMAYTEMALACLLNDKYEDVIEYSKVGRAINEKTPIFLNNTYWPFFAIIHHAQALIGLNRDQEALGMLYQTLEWRESKYGKNDVESFKLGYTLQVLGTIRAREGKEIESLDLFSRALTNYKATTGLNHVRSGHVLVKLAEAHAALGHLDTADILFDQALKVFSSHSAYNRELARTLFKKGVFYAATGNDDKAKEMYSNARALYWEVTQTYRDSSTNLQLEDYDRIVAIWAR